MASNAQVIWSRFKSAGYSDAACAAILGNWEAESAICPFRRQGDFTSGYSASQAYTNSVNSRSISEYDFVRNGPGGGGYGLAQWTYYTRKQELYNYTIKKGKSVGDLEAQISFALAELSGATSYKDYASVGSSIKNSTDLKAATITVLTRYEQPADQGSDAQNKRYSFAKKYFEQFAGKTLPNSTAQSPSTQTVSTGKAILSIAQGHVGEPEGKFDNDIIYAGSNHSEYCAMFLKWCADKAGVSIPGYNAYCPSWQSAAKNNKTWVDKNSVQSGDILFFNFDGGSTAVHVGILESRSGNTLTTIEGNTSNPNNSKQEGVYRKTRPLSYIVGGQRLNGTTTAPVNQSGSAANSTAASSVSYSIDYKTVTAEVKTSNIVTADADANALRTRANNLLTTPTLVESPFIILQVGEYTFGSYSSDGSYANVNSSFSVNFPNYMTGIKITKVNGQVNQYQITMTYQIRNGDDPNLLDKIFSSVGYGKVHISYGDWNAPKFIYKEEEAIITKLNTNVDFANSRITYTLFCTSNALLLLANYHDEPAGTLKPSEKIYQMIYNQESKYHLQEIFNGFANNKEFFWKNVAADDVSVEVVSKRGIDALSYINYLVTCMSPSTTSKTSALRDANYYLTICEDKEAGTYFTIKKVSSSEGIISLNNSDVYEVDVGYPGDTMVTSFRIDNDNSWSLLYNYSEAINIDDYIYNIDSEGNIYSSYSPGITTSNRYLKTTETQRNWWTQMTQFPVTATLTIKGLLRPAMLMSYVRINALFYGLRHVSSGLYIITKQVDSIDASGYRTTLSLTRVAGDLDVIVTDTKTVTRQIPVKVRNNNTASGAGTTVNNSGFSGSSGSIPTSGSASSSDSSYSGRFKPRTSQPEYGNKFYNNSYGVTPGISTCIYGNMNSETGVKGLNTLPNCVGYATGRFNEIIGSWKYALDGMAYNALNRAKGMGLSTGSEPQLGAMLCWGYTTAISSSAPSPGHVAIVESIGSDGSITISEGGWSNQKVFGLVTYKKGEWKNVYGRVFYGFIYNPGVSSTKTEKKW